jgi:hypothetical protein
MRPRRAELAQVRTALLLFMLATRVLAHPLDDAVVEAHLEPGRARLSMLLAHPLIASYDENGDRLLSSLEVEKHRTELTSLLGKHLGLSPGAELEVQADEQAVALEAHTRLLALALWPQPLDAFELDYSLWPPRADGPKCFLVVQSSGRSISAVLSQEHPKFRLPLTWRGRLQQRATPIVLALGLGAALALLALGRKSPRGALGGAALLAAGAAYWLVRP